jgi:DNA-binding PadR family transcriptional regulator
MSVLDRDQMSIAGQSENVTPERLLPLSTANFHILLSVADHECHGYAIMQNVKKTTGGAIRLGPGTLYRCVQALLRDGLLEESARRPLPAEDQRRRYYRLTQLGRRILALETERLTRLLAVAKSTRLLRKLKPRAIP